MRRLAWLVAALTLVVAAQATAQQDVGLSVHVGAAFPHGSGDSENGDSKITYEEWAPSFNYGFSVDIPLVETFRLSPFAELYRLNDQNVTDMGIGFNLTVPADQIRFYAGFVPGISAVGDQTLLHLGVEAGTAFPLVANLELFTAAKYKFIFPDDDNIRVLHGRAGIVFNL